MITVMKIILKFLAGKIRDIVLGSTSGQLELQAAVGLAQIGKLKQIVDSQQSFARVLTDILPSENVVKINNGGSPSYDAFVVNTGSRATAKKARKLLISLGFGSKILPEALTWHFSGEFKHIPMLTGIESIDSKVKAG